uniref:Putative secreted protein n=1 Tax=Ixodes ricinus TaxID=34613 RepID=A0A6B0UGN9_IXORI
MKAISVLVVRYTVIFGTNCCISWVMAALSEPFSITIVRWYPIPKRFLRNSDVPAHRSFPLQMMAFQSARISASSMKCVVRTMTLPSLRFWSWFQRWRLE